MKSGFYCLLALGVGLVQAQWPNGPLVTSGRWIHNAKGANVTYVGVNWPGAADVMIPEGLQYASIASIVAGIKSLGMNAIRLTFAIEMIDDIMDNGGDVTLSAAFTKALGAKNGTAVYKKVLANNPSFNATTTRVQVYDAIAKECHRQQIYVHLDNHISKGTWCCDTDDGNSWFGDTYFDVKKWKRGLEFMAKRGASWGSFTSIGMRNELRSPDDNSTLVSTSYNWSDWYKNMVAAAKVVNAANPDILIFFSGLNFDTTLQPVLAGTSLGSGVTFKKSDFTFANKIVMELHNYQNTATSCSTLKSDLVSDGFSTLTAASANAYPVVVTEWGHDWSNTDYKSVYATCLHDYLSSKKVGWTLWVVAGSYYIRQGTQDYEETWGLYNHDWSAWRNPAGIANLKTMISATLS